MGRTLLSVAVLVPVAALSGGSLWRASALPRRSWPRLQMRLAGAGALLTVPAAVALGAVDGTVEGVGAFLLWGLLAGVFFFAARYDVQEGVLDSDTRWLLDIAVLAFTGVTVFFSAVDFGYVFLPSAALMLVSWRLAHLRRRRDLRRTTS